MTIDSALFDPARDLFATINFACDTGRLPTAIDDLEKYKVKNHLEAVVHQAAKPVVAIGNLINGKKKDFNWVNEASMLELIGQFERVLIQTAQNLDNEIALIRAQDNNQNTHSVQLANLIRQRHVHEENIRNINERLAQRNQVLERLQANTGMGVNLTAGGMAAAAVHGDVVQAREDMEHIRREMTRETAAVRTIEEQMRAIDGKYDQSATFQRLSRLEGVRAQIRTLLDDSPENPRSLYQIRNNLETLRNIDILTAERDRFRLVRDQAQNRVTELELTRADVQNEIDTTRRTLNRLELEQSGQSTEGLALHHEQDNKYKLPETVEGLREYLGIPSAPPLYRNTGLYLKMEVAEHNLGVAREDFNRTTGQLEGATDRVNTFYERRTDLYNRTLDLLLQFSDHRMAAPAYHHAWWDNTTANLAYHRHQFIGINKASDVELDRFPLLTSLNNKRGQVEQADRKISIHSTNTDLHRDLYSPLLNTVIPAVGTGFALLVGAPGAVLAGGAALSAYGAKRMLDKTDDRIQSGCFEQKEAAKNVMQLREVVNQEYQAAIRSNQQQRSL